MGVSYTRRDPDPLVTMARRDQRRVEQAHPRRRQSWGSPLTRIGEGAVGGVVFFTYIGWLFFF